VTPRFQVHDWWIGHGERSRSQSPAWTETRLLKRFEFGSRRFQSRA